MTLWNSNDIRFQLADDDTDHPIVTLHIETPAGRLYAMAVVERLGRCIALLGLHVHGDRTAVNQVGSGNLRRVARAFMEVFDVETLLVTGGIRTTGARPGKGSRRLRFTRRRSADLGRDNSRHSNHPGDSCAAPSAYEPGARQTYD
jgi:hypothetical protein